MTASRKRRRTARSTPARRSLDTEELILYFTIFVGLTGPIGQLDYSNSIRVVLLLGAALLTLLLVRLSRQRPVPTLVQLASPQRRALVALALIALLALSMAAGAVQERLRDGHDPPAEAASSSPAYVRYHVTAAVVLRSGPGPGYPAVEEIGAGTPVDVTCQQRAVDGEAKLWDRLTGGQWVLDEATDSPNHGRNTLSPPGRWC